MVSPHEKGGQVLAQSCTSVLRSCGGIGERYVLGSERIGLGYSGGELEDFGVQVVDSLVKDRCEYVYLLTQR